MDDEAKERAKERRAAFELKKAAFAKALGAVGTPEAKAKLWREYDAASDLCDSLDTHNQQKGT
jgi:hypothetical protein